MNIKDCSEVVILMATYNGEKYLEEQLDSLLRQKISWGGHVGNCTVASLEESGSSDKDTDSMKGGGIKSTKIVKNIEDIDNGAQMKVHTEATTTTKASQHIGSTKQGSSRILDYKIYIHDDGSNDNTVAIIRNYIEKYPGKISLIEGPPTGSAKNNFFYLMREVSRLNEMSKADQRVQNDKGTQGPWINQEHQDAKGIKAPKYFFFCDQDDVWLEDKLQIELSVLKQLERDESNHIIPSLVWCDMKVVDNKLNEISQSFSSYSHLTPDELDIDRCIMHGKAAGCSMACNAQLISLCCEIQKTENIVMHDWALFLIARIAGRLKYIDKPLALYRQHGHNSLGAANEGKLQMLTGIIGRLVSLRQLRATQVNLKRYIAQVASLKQVKEVYRLQQELIDGANEFMRMSRIDKVRFINKFKLYRHRSNKLWSSVAAFLI